MMYDTVFREIRDSIDTKKRINIPEIIDVTEQVINAYKKGNKTIWFGNGGSAADAQHIVAELVGRYQIDRLPMNGLCLNTNVSTLTAISNDYEYHNVFKRQIKACCKKDDIVVGISTSGRSFNVLTALEVSKEIGCKTVLMTGEIFGRPNYVDHIISVPSKDTPRIQESHILIGHIICKIVEKEIYGM